LAEAPSPCRAGSTVRSGHHDRVVRGQKNVAHRVLARQMLGRDWRRRRLRASGPCAVAEAGPCPATLRNPNRWPRAGAPHCHVGREAMERFTVAGRAPIGKGRHGPRELGVGNRRLWISSGFAGGRLGEVGCCNRRNGVPLGGGARRHGRLPGLPGKYVVDGPVLDDSRRHAGTRQRPLGLTFLAFSPVRASGGASGAGAEPPGVDGGRPSRRLRHPKGVRTRGRRLMG